MRYEAWSTVGDLKTARERILTNWGSKPGKLPPDDWLFKQINWGGKVLDFGCGVGRNTLSLAQLNREVVGFDFPSMLSLMVEEKGALPANIRLASDWNQVKAEQFDAAIASLVFQHIHPDDLRVYLVDLAKMTKVLYVRGRIINDFNNVRVHDVLLEGWNVTRVFPPEASVEDLNKLGPQAHYAVGLEPK